MGPFTVPGPRGMEMGNRAGGDGVEPIPKLLTATIFVHPAVLAPTLQQGSHPPAKCDNH